MRKSFAILIATAALAVGSSAAAHTAWLVKDAQPGVYRLQFGGHEGKLEPANLAKLKDLSAMDSRGRPLRVSRVAQGTELHISVTGQPALIALHYDNGIYSRTSADSPSIEKPMNQVPGAVSATSAVKFGKMIVRWTPIVTQPIRQPFEVIPIDAAQPRAGQPMRVQVRINGVPAAGIKLGRGEDTADAITDANGMGSFVPTAGPNKLWAGKRIPTTGNPLFTELSYEYILSFDARPARGSEAR